MEKEKFSARELWRTEANCLYDYVYYPLAWHGVALDLPLLTMKYSTDFPSLDEFSTVAE